MKKPLLALVAHASDGKEYDFLGELLGAGVHLRWAFRRELGFPLGGFCVFRRESQVPQMASARLDTLSVPPHTKEVRLKVAGSAVNVSSKPFDLAKTVEPTQSAANDIYKALGIKPLKTGPTATLGSAKKLSLSFVPRPFVLLDLVAANGTKLELRAYSGGRLIDTRSATYHGTVLPFLFSPSYIEQVIVEGTSPRIVRICMAVEEPLEGADTDPRFLSTGVGTAPPLAGHSIPHALNEWVPVAGCPICLPITHVDYPCPNKDNCDRTTALERLPKPPLANEYRAEIDGLLLALKTVVDRSLGPTMGSRYLQNTQTEDQACADTTATPMALRMAALDMLLAASLDPYVARMLGLYLVDTDAKEGHSYDYKVVGHWPEGTLWSLGESVDFDALPAGTTLSKAFVHRGMTFVGDCAFSIAEEEHGSAGVRRGLTLGTKLETQWPFLTTTAAHTRRLFLRFEQPVCEVLVHAQRTGLGSGLDLRAFRHGAEVALTQSTAQVASIAVHAQAIDTIEILGDLAVLWKIDFGEEYLPHGSRRYIAYGVKMIPPRPMVAPSGVTATALPALTKKQADCAPPLSGTVLGERYPVGIGWAMPNPSNEVLSEDPVLFRIERKASPGGHAEMCTGPHPLLLAAPGESTPNSSWKVSGVQFTDVVAKLGWYEYRVCGIDIFGRQSGFSMSPAMVKIQPTPPAPPTNVKAKWLDPRDPYLSDIERKWVDQGIGGLLVCWEWTANLERQSPGIEKFHVVYQEGWLNQLSGTVEGSPSIAESGSEFSVMVRLSRAVPTNGLAGMALSHGGKPYRILQHMPTVEDTPGFHVTTLTCRVLDLSHLNMTMGDALVVPLTVSVRARVEQLDEQMSQVKGLTLLTRDLLNAPPAGLMGATLESGGRSFRLSSVVECPAGSVRGVRLRAEFEQARSGIETARIRGLKDKSVMLNLPTLPSLLLDYHQLQSWAKACPPVAASGSGTYRLFIRKHRTPGEPLGCFQVSPREHQLIEPRPPIAGAGTVYGQVAVASDALVVGAASSPATFVRSAWTKPEAPGFANQPSGEAFLYADAPDFLGRAAYVHRWMGEAKIGYVVYRALDAVIFDVDRRVGPSRSKVRAHWDGFLSLFDHYGEAVCEEAFATFVIRSQEPPNYEAISNRPWLMQILASFPDISEAFIPLHGTPIRCTGSENTATTQCEYLDNTLPGHGTDKYLYRIRATDDARNSSPLSLSSLPVCLKGGLPRTPVITRVTSGERKITLSWASNREIDLLEYRVYRASSAEDARDLQSMTQVAVVAADPDPVARPAEVAWTDEPVRGLVDYWYRVAAVDRSDPVDPHDGSGNVSDASPAAVARAYDQTPPIPPPITALTWVRVDSQGGVHGWNDAAPAGEIWESAVQLSWQEYPDDWRLLVERQADSDENFRPTSNWLPPATTSYLHSASNSFEGNTYRLKALSGAGNSNVIYDAAQLPSVS